MNMSGGLIGALLLGQVIPAAWAVEIRRALVTGDGNDIQLGGSGPSYFGVSIYDDAEKDEHAHMGRDVLLLRFK